MANRNAGLDVASVTSLAQNVAIPIFPIGMGSDKLPVKRADRGFGKHLNVRMQVINFKLTRDLQLTGMPNAAVQLQLISLPVQGA